MCACLSRFDLPPFSSIHIFFLSQSTSSYNQFILCLSMPWWKKFSSFQSPWHDILCYEADLLALSQTWTPAQSWGNVTIENSCLMGRHLVKGIFISKITILVHNLQFWRVLNTGSSNIFTERERECVCVCARARACVRVCVCVCVCEWVRETEVFALAKLWNQFL
jgi:hypothetical protein